MLKRLVLDFITLVCSSDVGSENLKFGPENLKYHSIHFKTLTISHLETIRVTLLPTPVIMLN